MTLIIENVREEFLPAFRGLARSIDAKMKTQKTQKDFIQRLEKESEAIEKSLREGKLKTYKSAKEMHEDILSEV